MGMIPLTAESGFDRRILGRAKRLDVGQGVGIFRNEPGVIEAISRYDSNMWNASRDGNFYLTDGENLEYVYEKTPMGSGPRTIRFQFFTHLKESVTTQPHQDENEPFDMEPDSQNGLPSS